MKKEFEISGKLNLGSFDRDVEQMVKKLREVSAPLNNLQQNTAQRAQQLGVGGPISQGAMEAFNKASQSSKRELDQLISSQVKSQEQFGKLIASQANGLKKLQEEQKVLIEGSDKYRENQEKIAKSIENQANMRQAYRQRDAAISEALDIKQGMSSNSQQSIRDRNPGGWGLAGRYAKQGMYGAAAGEAYDTMGGFAGIAGGAGTLFAGIGVAGALGERVSGYGQRLQEARGSAIENSAGQNLRDVYGGRSPFEAAFSQERNAAAGLAKQKEDRNRITDRLKGLGGIGAAAATGAAVGTAFMPGIGTAAGAIIGGGAAWLNSDDRTRQSINPFGQGEYDELLAKDRSKDFRSSYEDLKNQDPGKRLGLEYFEQNNQRDVRAQRQLGLSDRGFYGQGGFLNDVQQGGFMGEQGINMANSIVGAGGSARMGGQARFGLQMERAGLTNASSILGATSGSIQNPEANKQATISIMSEAFKIGLDNTQFAEENRKFSQAAAAVIGRTGATNESDQDRITQALGQFLGQRTNAGVQEAQSAYERSQERGSQTEGRRGVLRYAAAMKDKNLSRMNPSDLTEFLSMRPEQLNESNPAAHEFARAAGFNSIKELQEAHKNVNDAGRYLMPGQREKVNSAKDAIQQYMQENNMSRAQLEDEAAKGSAGNIPQNIIQAMGRMGIEKSKTDNAAGLTKEQVFSSVSEDVNQGPMTAEQGKAQANAALNDTSRVADEFTKNAAAGADEARKNFDGMRDSLMELTQATKDFISTVAPGAGVLRDAAERNNRSMPQGQGSNSDILNLFANTGIPTGAQQQPSPNKPKGQ